MTTIRLKFIKNNSVKFISHLDMMKAFQRGVRRAGLMAEYSQGFNPQMQMVFGAPLSLGFTSEAEFADFTFLENYEPGFVMEQLNRVLPKGLSVLDSGIRNTNINIMADIKAAEYNMEVASEIPVAKIADYILKSDELQVEKIRKGRTKIIDVRQLVLKASETDGLLCVMVKAGNQSNLNPRLLIKAINNKGELQVEAGKYNRISQFVKREDKLISPLDKLALETK